MAIDHCATMRYTKPQYKQVAPENRANGSGALPPPTNPEGRNTTMTLIAYLGLVVIAGPIVALSIFAGVYNAIEGMWK